MCSAVVNSMGLGGLFASLNDPGAANACGQFQLSYLADPMCWGNSFTEWQNAFYGISAAPSGTVLATPPPPSNIVTPVTGSDPNAIITMINGMLRQQGQAQQQIDANYLDATAPSPSTPDSCAAYTADWPWPFSGITCPNAFLWGVVGVFAFVAISGGSPRRYGR